MRATKTSISPTLLCADQLSIGEAIQRLDNLEIAWHHVDIMDGHFVPNMAFGLLSLQQICKRTKKPVCAHFMVENPSDYVDVCADMKLDYFVFHLEAERNPIRLIKKIKESGMKAGIAINPITPVEALTDILCLLDEVLIMAVEPGFSGQTYLDFTYNKIRKLVEMRKNSSFLIEVDGGITMENTAACAECGADVLVGGDFTLFSKENTLENNFARMEKLLRCNDIANDKNNC